MHITIIRGYRHWCTSQCGAFISHVTVSISSAFASLFTLFYISMILFESRPHIWSHGTHDLTDCHQNTVMRLFSNIWFGHSHEEWLTALGWNMEIITGLEQGAGLQETLRTKYWKRCRKCSHDSSVYHGTELQRLHLNCNWCCCLFIQFAWSKNLVESYK